MTPATGIRINFGTWLLATAFFLLAAGCGQDAVQKPAPSPKPKTAQPAQPPAGDKPSGSIFVYCAGGVKEPVSELARAFEAESGVQVQTTFANAGQLLGQIELTGTGDVYVPGDVGFVAMAKEKRLVADDGKIFCYMVPTIIVPKGNPKGIKALKDLAAPGVRLVLADSKSAIGVLQEKVFAKNGIDREALKKNAVDAPSTPMEVALKVKMGAADAGIVWETVAVQFADGTQSVGIPLEQNVVGTAQAAALTCSKNPRAAAAFVDYLASEKGKQVLRAKHYTVEPPGATGGVAAERPPGGEALLLLAAASTADAVTVLAAAFEKKTGIKVKVSTGASNALAAQILAGVPGQVFLSANEQWAKEVEDKGLSLERRPLLTNVLVIVAPKGNPAAVASPADLLREKVRRVALAGEKVPAGLYAEQALRGAKVYDELIKQNRVARGQDVRLTLGYVETGEAEAGVVYATDARASAKVEVVYTFPPKSHEPVIYPLVLLKSSGGAEAGRRLFDFLASAEAMAEFEKLGFSPAPKPDRPAKP